MFGHLNKPPAPETIDAPSTEVVRPLEWTLRTQCRPPPVPHRWGDRRDQVLHDGRIQKEMRCMRSGCDVVRITTLQGLPGQRLYRFGESGEQFTGPEPECMGVADVAK